MADLLLLAKFDFLGEQGFVIMEYINSEVGILLNPTVSQSCMPVTRGTDHNFFAGITTSDNNHVFTRLNEIRIDVEGQYVDSGIGTCMAIHASNSKGWVSRLDVRITRTTFDEGLVFKHPEEVTHCTKKLRSSESGIEECAKGEECDKRKASHGEGEDGPVSARWSAIGFKYLLGLLFLPRNERTGDARSHALYYHRKNFQLGSYAVKHHPGA